MADLPPWQDSPVWQPPSERGVLVLESDDGNVTDYTSLFPSLQQTLAPNTSPWAPFAARGLATSCLNKFNIATKLSNAQILEMAAAGWGIYGHGKLHCGLQRFRVEQPITAGDTRLHLTEGGRAVAGGGDDPTYVYRITDGSTSETFSITDSDGAQGSGWVDLASPIANSYGTYDTDGTYVVLTVESAEYEIGGNKADIEAVGITPAHYTYPFGPVASELIPVVAAHFSSGRTTSHTLNLPGEFDVYQLGAHTIAAAINDLDGILDATSEGDAMFMVYMHGETDAMHFHRLRLAIEGARARRIAIMRRDEALTYYAWKYGAWWE